VNKGQVFESRVLPHLDAAYNLARWLLRNDQSAEDAVQEASMRAFRYIDSLRGDDARPSAIRALSPSLREVIVLREFEDLEYAQISMIVAAPIGTVMSRLSRARKKLRGALPQAKLGA
jgi:DNA-directed RNA polymerase specialized sigma24 family protein